MVRLAVSLRLAKLAHADKIYTSSHSTFYPMFSFYLWLINYGFYCQYIRRVTSLRQKCIRIRVHYFARTLAPSDFKWNFRLNSRVAWKKKGADSNRSFILVSNLLLYFLFFFCLFCFSVFLFFCFFFSSFLFFSFHLLVPPTRDNRLPWRKRDTWRRTSEWINEYHRLKGELFHNCSYWLLCVSIVFHLYNFKRS